MEHGLMSMAEGAPTSLRTNPELMWERYRPAATPRSMHHRATVERAARDCCRLRGARWIAGLAARARRIVRTTPARPSSQDILRVAVWRLVEPGRGEGEHLAPRLGNA